MDKVAILLKKAVLEFDKIANPKLDEYQLTTSQYKVLKFLFSRTSKTARVVDIEKYYSMTHPTTLGLLDKLEQKGFISRIENPDDRRSKLILLTEKATAMQTELEGMGNFLEETLTKKLSTSEKSQLIYLLNKLLESENRNVFNIERTI